MVDQFIAFIEPFFNNYLLLTAVFIGFALSSVWMIFFLLEDRHKPEPLRAIIRAFIVGMVSALSAIGLEKIFLSALTPLGFHIQSDAVVIGNALIEEAIKFLVIFVFISKTKYFDEPVDRMIYMILSGLGFAAAENFFFFSNASTVTELTGLIILRFTGATFMHALTSGMLGYYWAKKWIFTGIIVATIIHSIFNLLVLRLGPDFYPITFLVVIAFILFYEFDRIKTYYERKKLNRRGNPS